MRTLRSCLAGLAALLAVPAQAAWDARIYDGGLLNFHVYRPAAEARAIAVVLHGCRQTARGFAEHSGWTRVAEDQRLLLLAPEFESEERTNCFNWFSDAVRPSRAQMVGELRSGVTRLAEAERLERVFFTGLSAGGAMAAVLLAESAGWEGVTPLGAGIVAGIVYGCTDVIDPLVPIDGVEALMCMDDATSGFGSLWETMLPSYFQAMVRTLGSRAPAAVSLWHGTEDRRVDHLNAVYGGRQWARAMGLAEPQAAAAPMQDASRPLTYLRAGTERARVEVFLLQDMAHKMPINVSGPGYRCGSLPDRAAGDDHYDDSGICAAHWIARAMLGEVSAAR